MVNEQVLEGNWKEIKGKLRSRWGQLMDDELEQVHGNADQLVGAIQRRTGAAKVEIEKFLEQLTNDGSAEASGAAETVRQYAQSATATMSSATKEAADALRRGYEQAERTVEHRPFESLGVCFGVGLITGVVVGMMLRSGRS